jgi:hypothetical protein
MGKASPTSGLALTLIALASLLCAGSSAAPASQASRAASHAHHEYTQASLSGNYAFVGTYAANIAANLGVVTFDGLGSVKGSVTVNQPGPVGSRTIVKVTVAGTYSVQSDGTGIIRFTVTLPNGTTSDVTEDFVITKAENRNGTLIATSIFEAQEQPSVVITGDVFVTHTYTRRPD